VGGRHAYLPDMAHKMISNQKVVNNEVSEILGIYNFHFGSFYVRGNLGPVILRPTYLPDMAHKTISNQKVVNYEVTALFA
jgi:glutathionyl-hydroquinone reductase